MTAITSAILWMTVQVLLFSLAGAALFLLLRRRGPNAAGACAAIVLGLTLLIVLLMVSPWPRWVGKAQSPNSKIGSISVIGDEYGQHVPPSPRAAAEIDRDAAWPLFSTITTWGQTAVQLLQSGGSSIDGQNASGPARTAWILWMFAVGIGWGLARLAVGLWVVGNLRRQSTPVDDGLAIDDLNSLVQQFQLAEAPRCNRLEIRESSRLRSAATIGWREPVLLLPPDWRSWTATQRRVVLAHELAHVARRDYLTGLVARLASAIHFYQPLVLWLGRQLRIQQELAADSAAAGVVGGKQIYLSALAQLALRADDAPVPWAARAFLPGTSMLIKRVAWMKQRDPKTEKSLSRSVRWLLAAIMIAVTLGVAGIRGPSESLSAVAMAAPPEEKQADQLPKELHQIGQAPSAVSKVIRTFDYVPADAKLVIAFSPNTLTKLFSAEKFTSLFDQDAGFAKKFGIKVSEVADVEVVRSNISIPGGKAPFDRLIVRSQSPQDWKKTIVSFNDVSTGPKVQRMELDGKEYFEDPAGPCFYVPDERTLIVGPKEEILKVLRGGEVLMQAGEFPEFQTEPLAIRAEMSILKAMAGLDKLPKDFEKNPAAAMFLPLIDHVKVECGYVDANSVADKAGFHARLECDSPDGAQQVAKTLEALRTVGLNLLQAKIQAWRQATPTGATAEQVGQVNQFFDMVVKSLTDGKIVAVNKSVEVSTKLDLNKAVVAGFLMPAVAAGREAAMRTQSMNNMKQLGLAMYNFEAAKRNFPPAALRDKDGKLVLSWRVAILPFIEQDALYKEFHLDEPWDSEHNKALIAKMPAVFRDPHEDAGSTNSSYFMPTGKGMIGGSESGTQIKQIADGTSRTILLVEAKRDIPWTKPEDIEIDADPLKPLPELGGHLVGNYFGATFADGHVEIISKNADPKVLRAILTIDGHEPVDPGEINQKPAGESSGTAAPSKMPLAEPFGNGSMKIEFHRAENEPAAGLTVTAVSDGPNVKIYLHPEAELTNADIEEATATSDNLGQPVVSVSFTAQGAEKMTKLTEENLGKPMVIMVDGKVLSAPIIRSKIAGGKAQISGNFTKDEAERIAKGISRK